VHKHKNGGVIKIPGGDGTGPSGWGPRTGRAAGYCAGYPIPGYANPIPRFGRRFGAGRGRGRGFRRWYGVYPIESPYAYVPAHPNAYAHAQAPMPQSLEDELAALEECKNAMAAEKESIQQESADIENKIKELKEKINQQKGTQ